MASPREVATTPASIGGFDAGASALDLADFLESVAGPVVRCRVKTTWTPPDYYPDFHLHDPDAAALRRRRCVSERDAAALRTAPPPPYESVTPHAFVHFAHPDAARRAARSGLLLRHTHSGSAKNSALRAARRRDTRPFRFTGSRVEAGNLRTPYDFVAAWRATEDAVNGTDFAVDPFDDTCRVVFSRDAAFAFPGFQGASDAVVLSCDVKLEFPILDIDEVLVFRTDNSVLIRLSAAPLLYYRTAADDVHQPAPFDLIDDDDDGDPWIRTTDITASGAVGRCWVYRISFSAWLWPEMEDALAYMKARVPVVVCDGGGWPRLAVRDEPEFGQRMQDPFFSVQHPMGLGFPVCFLVNALVHKGIVNQHQLTPEFFGFLKREEDDVNVDALLEFLGEKFPVFDVCRRLKDAQDRAAKNPKLLRLRSSSSSEVVGDYNVEVWSLVITPTRAHCLQPRVERSNRVIRHYHQVADRFLRVTFMDEGMQLLNTNALYFHAAPIVKDLMPNTLPQNTTVYRRVRKILTKGFHLCGRKYSFLAFSSNQLRNRSAWFFAEDGMITAASIQGWMGQFPSKNVAKHAARMGQCFTSSYATVMMQPDEVNEFLEDVTHNGYNFSDGIGKITPDLAMEVARRLPLTTNYAPSAYQIRYAGFKGVIAIWGGQNDGIRLSLRPSMRKFESTHSVLEVVSWTKFQPGFLNRQIITLLTSLGVPDSVFWEMQGVMVHNLDRVLSHSNAAYEVATRSCGAGHGTYLGLMLSAGFTPSTEPHLRAMLLAIKSSQLQGLLEKTKIFVPKARWLMGCLDELGILEQGQCFIRASTPSLSNCFMKHGSRFSSANRNAEIIVGTIVMAKNPCLHPGDVRILEAVDVPELHHLVDCLVFPKKGERPHANEASGSDLDGDVYFVTWDEKLVPPGKMSWNPMDYSPAEAKQLWRTVRQHDIIDFFVKNMATDTIGRISNAHVVHADRSKYRAMDEKCIQLAELAAIAVDFPKTGKIVTMPPSLRPKEYPDFMEKEDDISYKSDKIIGKLYRSIKWYIHGRSLEGDIRNDIPYDTDLEVPGAAGFLAEAWQCKCSYNARLNTLLNQFSVRTEAELVTGEMWSLTENNRRKKHATKERLKLAYSKLFQEFRSIFESIAAGQDEIPDDKKNMVYEMKASAWYQVTYHPVWIQQTREMMEPNGEAKLSFAWIASDYLARIKVRRCGGAKIGGPWPLKRARSLHFREDLRTAKHFACSAVLV